MKLKYTGNGDLSVMNVPQKDLDEMWCATADKALLENALISGIYVEVKDTPENTPVESVPEVKAPEVAPVQGPTPEPIPAITPEIYNEITQPEPFESINEQEAQEPAPEVEAK